MGEQKSICDCLTCICNRTTDLETKIELIYEQNTEILNLLKCDCDCDKCDKEKEDNE